MCNYIYQVVVKILVRWAKAKGKRSTHHLPNLRVDLNEGCFLGLFQYFHEISVQYLSFFSYRKIPKFRENTEKN